jgi:hypothetical protein
MRKTTAAIAAAAAVALLAACGSSSKSSSTSSSPSTSGASSSAAGPSVAAWRAQTNTICTNAVTKAAQTPRPTSLTAAALSTYTTAVINELNGMATSIKAVKAPAQFTTVQQHMVSDLGTTVNALKQVNSQQLAGGAWLQAIQALSTTPAAAQAEQDYIARTSAAGLTACQQVHLGA